MPSLDVVCPTQSGIPTGVPFTLHCPLICLPELLDELLVVILESPQQFVLGDFNILVVTAADKTAQDLVASMAAMGLSQLISVSTHRLGHMLDLIFFLDQTNGELKMGDVAVTPLSRSDHLLVSFRLTAPPCIGGGL